MSEKNIDAKAPVRIADTSAVAASSLRFLLASGFDHLPQRTGGIQSNMNELARELNRHGHVTSVLAALQPSDFMGIYTRLRGKLGDKRRVHDTYMGYKTYRRQNVVKALPEIVEMVRPDVAIVHMSRQMALAKELRRLSVPVILYFHDVLFNLLDGDPGEVEGAMFLANSEFTARKIRERFQVEARVIPPLFDKTAYLSARKATNVTFINPCSYKGVDIAFELVARCPKIPFSFLEGWPISPKQLEKIRDFERRHSNLSFQRRTNNMKAIYRRAKIVLAPSRCEEAWGRVVTEAQYSGIPVIASDRGGLPEAVGKGGILIDPDGPVELWAETLQRLWHDEAFYSDLSAHALAHSVRTEIDPERQIDRLVAIAKEAMNNSH